MESSHSGLNIFKGYIRGFAVVTDVQKRLTRICRMLGAVTVGWTPKGETEIARAEKDFSAVIFERTPEEWGG